MEKWLRRLETFIGGVSGGGRRVKVFRILVLIGLIGAIMMLIASLMNVKPVDPNQAPNLSPPRDEDQPQKETFLGGGEEKKGNAFRGIEEEFEKRIKEMLEKVVGIGEVDVLVTVDSTEETVVQLNEKQVQEITEETDRNGAKRHVSHLTKDGQVVLYEVSPNVKSPFVVKKLKPHLRGVIIAANGSENASIKRLIAEAVSSGLDVPLHRVFVLPRKS